MFRQTKFLGHKEQKGFTLIELLVVIGIIALLASVVMVNLQGARRQGREASVRSTLKEISSSAEKYYNTNGSYTNMLVDDTIADQITSLGENSDSASSLVKEPGTSDYWCVSTVVNEKNLCIDATGTLYDGKECDDTSTTGLAGEWECVATAE